MKEVRTIIELNENSFKILLGVHDKPMGSMSRYISQQITGKDDSYISQAITAKLKENGGLKNFLYVVLPRRVFIFRIFLLPTHSEIEIKKMVALQIGEHIPYKEQEAVWEHIILEKMSDGYARVLLMVTNIDIIKRYLKVLSATGMNPTTVTISSWDLVGWLKRTKSAQNKFEKTVSFVLRIESSFTEICFCDHEFFYFSREIQLGSNDLNSGSIEELKEQINLTLVTYRKEKMGPDPTDCLVLSESSDVMLLEEYLKSIFGFVSFSGMQGDNIGGYDETYRGGLGILEMECKELSNFLPLNLKDNFNTRMWFKTWLRTFILFLCVLISMIAAFCAPLYKKLNQLDQLKQEVLRVHPQAEKAENKIIIWKAIQGELSNRIAMVDILDELYRLTPEDVTFTNLRFQGIKLNIQGQAIRGAAVNEFQSNLVNSTLFSNVTLQFANKKPAEADEITIFSITTNIQIKQSKNR
jgi:hypothetical protein